MTIRKKNHNEKSEKHTTNNKQNDNSERQYEKCKIRRESTNKKAERISKTKNQSEQAERTVKNESDQKIEEQQSQILSPSRDALCYYYHTIIILL